MRKEHLDLFSELPGNLVLSCFADGASKITGIFVFFTSDGTEVHVRAALRFGWKSLTRILQRAVLGDAFACRTAIGIRVVATELLQRLAFWTDVLVVLGIPIKVDTDPSAIPAASLINDWDVGRDLTVYQPTNRASGPSHRQCPQSTAQDADRTNPDDFIRKISFQISHNWLDQQGPALSCRSATSQTV